MIVLSNKKVKAKKEHHCNFCCNKIKIGETYNYQANVCSGDFGVWKSHIECSKIASKLNMYDECDEGLDSDTFCENIICEYDKINPNNIDKNFNYMLKYVIDYHKNKL